MIIDMILDRKDDEETMKQGFTHVQYPDGSLRALAYDAHRFYSDMMVYGADDITRAMDYGTEEDVRKALCDYIRRNDYNPEICDYINSREWLQ